MITRTERIKKLRKRQDIRRGLVATGQTFNQKVALDDLDLALIYAEGNRLPLNYICIALEESIMLFEFLRGRREGVNERLVALHLKLCAACQEAVGTLMEVAQSGKGGESK